MVVAINQALSVISWHENLPEDEQPPRAIWHSDQLLDDWFREVKERRKEKSSGKRSSYEKADDVPMMSNELASQYKP